jgi:Type II secretion system (T2SS), protein N
MRRTAVILVAIVAIALVAVAIAPASLAGLAVERASRGALTLTDADGTIWQGRGSLTAGSVLRLPVAWSIDAWPLLRGEIRLHVSPPTATGQAVRAVIIAQRNAVTLHELEVTLPAGIVSIFAPRSGFRTSGELRIAAPSLDWTPGTFLGGARVDWREARLAFGNDAGIGLGTVSASLTAVGDRLTGPVTNEGGEVELRGTLSIYANGAPNVSIAMTPRGGDAAQARTLTVTGTPGEAGRGFEFRMGP